MITQAQIEFIADLHPAAVLTASRYSLPERPFCSLSIGQALHESWRHKTDTPSRLATLANNYWGIKAFSSWKGETVSLDTFEFVDGKKVWLRGEKAPKWRKYPDKFQAFDNYAQILHGPRYAPAFRHLTGPVVGEEQEDAFIREIGQFWATDPNYQKYWDEHEDQVEEVLPMVEFAERILLHAKIALVNLRGG
jgi:flagellum-specific peptidoglycan hydrolase FlgJ